MFLILKTINWKPEDYVLFNVLPFGWCEDNNRAIKEEQVVAKVHTLEQRDFLLEKLNNKYVGALRRK